MTEGTSNQKKALHSFKSRSITSIIIVTYNQLDYTKHCIASIREHTDKQLYNIVVVDNNSTDGTVQWLGLQEEIIKIPNKENLGFPAACNQGIKAAGNNDILLLNNDTIVTAGWLSNLRNCLYSDNGIGAVGPVSNYCSNLQTISANYNSLDEMQQFAKKHNVSNSSKWEQRLRLIGFCLLIKNETIKKVGLFDEIFSPGNFEDDDYSMRIINSGYRLMLCKDTFIHHFGSVSFKKESENFTEIIETNLKKFEKKWGFNPNYSFFMRNDIIEMMDKPKNQDLNILELGCACGDTLLKTKSLFNNVKLYGIEINKNAASIASNFAEIKTGNIENIIPDYKEKFFDYIIMADVLEHTTEPWQILKIYSKFLRDDGEILASIPNIMHFSIIKDLIQGRFQYQDAGILDKTHLRFFTLHEIRTMFISCGYNILELKMVFLKPSSEDSEFIENLCKFSNKNLFEQYEAYQYLIKAQKIPS